MSEILNYYLFNVRFCRVFRIRISYLWISYLLLRSLYLCCLHFFDACEIISAIHFSREARVSVHAIILIIVCEFVMGWAKPFFKVKIFWKQIRFSYFCSLFQLLVWCHSVTPGCGHFSIQRFSDYKNANIARWRSKNKTTYLVRICIDNFEGYKAVDSTS